jgi:chromate transporter
MRYGLFTFGGGWSIIAQMQQLYVEKKKIITSEELLDLVSVAKSVPGIMIANVAMLYGYRAAGLAGGFVCVLGMCLPPMAVLIAVSFFYAAFRDNYWVNAAMLGMQAAVVPIIANAAKNLIKGSVKYPPCVMVVAASVSLYLFAEVNPVVLVVMGIFAGLAIGSYYERKGAQTL